jgi:hypothetical protein
MNAIKTILSPFSWYMKLRPTLYWVYRYTKGAVLQEESCGDCDAHGCRGECCGGCGW